MDFLQSLQAAPNTPQAQFNIFLINFKPTGNVIFAFVEGKEDLAFYGLHISMRTPQNFRISFVKCDNKKGVLRSHSEYLHRYPPNPRALFFIDRDHDELCGQLPIQSDFLFVSVGYSIENELCSDDVIRRYCVESLGLDTDAQAVSEAVTRFAASWQTFVTASLDVMAWIVAARRQGGALNLQNLDSKKVLRFDSASLTVSLAESQTVVFEYMCKVTGGNAPHPSIDIVEIDKTKVELQGLEANTWLRGKQVVWFLTMFLLAAEATMKAAGLSVKSKTPLHLDNAVEVLAAKLTKPRGLVEFLEDVFKRL